MRPSTHVASRSVTYDDPLSALRLALAWVVGAIALVGVFVFALSLLPRSNEPPNTDPRRGWASIPAPDHDGWTIGRKTCTGTTLVIELWSGQGAPVDNSPECAP